MFSNNSAGQTRNQGLTASTLPVVEISGPVSGESCSDSKNGIGRLKITDGGGILKAGKLLFHQHFKGLSCSILSVASWNPQAANSHEDAGFQVVIVISGCCLQVPKSFLS